MVRVEFIGLPGAGKSTIVKALVGELEKITPGIYYTEDDALYAVAKGEIDSVYRVIMTLLPEQLSRSFFSRLDHRSFWHESYRGQFLGKYYKSLQHVLSWEGFDGYSENDRGWMLTSFLKSGTINEAVSSLLLENARVLFDEGLLQKSMMFVNSSNDKDSRESVGQYLSKIPLPDITVYLDLNVSDCHARMLNRKKGLIRRIKTSEESEISYFLSKSQLHWDFVLDYLKNDGQVDILIQSASGSLESIVSELVRDLADLIGRRSPNVI